jgi:hypothetical protein
MHSCRKYTYYRLANSLQVSSYSQIIPGRSEIEGSWLMGRAKAALPKFLAYVCQYWPGRGILICWAQTAKSDLAFYCLLVCLSVRMEELGSYMADC